MQWILVDMRLPLVYLMNVQLPEDSVLFVSSRTNRPNARYSRQPVDRLYVSVRSRVRRKDKKVIRVTNCDLIYI
jgi:hypothetical protein